MERPRGRLREPANRAAWTLSEGRGIQRLSGPLGIGERGLSMTGNRCNSCFALRVMFRRGKKKSWRGQSEGQGQRGGRIPFDDKDRSVWIVGRALSLDRWRPSGLISGFSLSGFIIGYYLAPGPWPLVGWLEFCAALKGQGRVLLSGAAERKHCPLNDDSNSNFPPVFACQERVLITVSTWWPSEGKWPVTPH